MKRVYRSIAFIGYLTALLPAPNLAYASAHIEWRCEDKQLKRLCAVSGSIDHIYIFDAISQQTADQIAQLDGIWPTGRSFPIVYVNSQGGDNIAAVQIGRILRRREATVETRDVFFPANRASCFSACVTIAAGATIRRLSHVGIHQAARIVPVRGTEVRREPIEDGERALDRLYWNEMGIPEEINQIEDDTPHTQMAEFFLDPSSPLKDQAIVRLGFWMGPAPQRDETLIADRSSQKTVLEAGWQRGNASAAYALGNIFANENRGMEATLWLNRAGEAGIPYAWHNLAVFLASKRNPRGPNHIQASRYYRMAAERGFAGAQNNLGWAYYKGNGVPKNYSEAIYWLTRAAEQGEPFAYGSLGAMRFYGHGFRRDDVETYKWLKLAIDNLPPGNALEADRKLFNALTKRMSRLQVALAQERVTAWRPLRPTAHRIGDKVN